MSNPPPLPAPPDLLGRVVTILEQARGHVLRAVNANMVLAYWLIGREIVEAVQQGQERAAYGKRVMEELSASLAERYGKGFSVTNLWYFRQFYLAFQNRGTIPHPPGGESDGAAISSRVGRESVTIAIRRPAGDELGDNVIETIINQSEKVKALKKKAQQEGLSAREKKELSAEEKELKSQRKLVQEKLIKFATRIPAFMYLTDFRENTLRDVITRLEPELFLTVTGLTVADFHLLVQLKVFNTEQMNAAVFAFRRYEDASLRYTGLESHQGLAQVGLYDTMVALQEAGA